MEHSPLAEAVLEVPGLEVGQLYSKELLELLELLGQLQNY